MNQDHKQALELLTTVNDRISKSGGEMMYGNVEITLKKKTSGYNSDNMLLD